MQVQSIRIKNFRSIEDLTFEINALGDDSYTFGLIGVNEAGKSSLLKAISLKDSTEALTPLDFKDKAQNIEILYVYKLEDKDETTGYNDLVNNAVPNTTVLTSHIFQAGDLIGFKLTFSIKSPSKPIYEIVYSGKKELSESVKTEISAFDWAHSTVFWTAKGEYLISNAINLTEFSQNPNISIPLKNCFQLADITDIKASIENFAGDTTEKKLLEKRLSNAVTEHILKVWPGHPIKIVFDIDGQVITFQVEDSDGEKAKTAVQRSDGFKQFISFLLTISAEDSNEELKNCLLLLDEPETHLHPRAQEYFLSELKTITMSNRGNIVIFATHSNYMIDKENLTRNYKVTKEKESTKIDLIDTTNSTFGSVNYEIFEIPSSDYHSELYESLRENFIGTDSDDGKRQGILKFDTDFLAQEHGLEKDKPWKGNKKQATLPTFIRNCIHYPRNGDKYNRKDLIDSIELLRGIAQKQVIKPKSATPVTT